MINRSAIQEWGAQVPWTDNAQVEQDLLISRCLVAIFNDNFLRNQLAFRGGTALHKLYLSPQPRYSEDIDLVQITAGPIKSIMSRLGEVLDFMPNKVTKQKRYNNTMLFRMDSEIPPVMPIRLKLEIICFEHFTDMGLVEVPFSVGNKWFSGSCKITTYQFAELLGTKLRALYQRKKGRDLFDLYVALKQTDVNPDDVIRCYHKYMRFTVQQPPTYKQFILNMEEKIQDPDFLGDSQLLLRPEISFNPQEAYLVVKERLIDRLSWTR